MGGAVEPRGRVGLIHLDVEGFEAAAIRGARRLIAEDAPVIITEHHEGDAFDDALLLAHGYSAATIPEICGPNLSCRNVLWLPPAAQARGAHEAIRAELESVLRPESSPVLP